MLVPIPNKPIDVGKTDVVSAAGDARNRLKWAGTLVDGHRQPIALVVAPIDGQKERGRRSLQTAIERKLDRNFGRRWSGSQCRGREHRRQKSDVSIPVRADVLHPVSLRGPRIVDPSKTSPIALLWLTKDHHAAKSSLNHEFALAADGRHYEHMNTRNLQTLPARVPVATYIEMKFVRIMRGSGTAG